ncbi:C2H2 finger domain-containing protein [Seiridium cupressi]
MAKFTPEASQRFRSSFLNLLSLNHQEKWVHSNRFYQTYIADRDHVRMNTTQWDSLTAFVQWLGREGRCRVENSNDGAYISYIDRSEAKIQRAEALRRKLVAEESDRRQGDRLLSDQIKRAHARVVDSTIDHNTGVVERTVPPNCLERNGVTRVWAKGSAKECYLGR